MNYNNNSNFSGKKKEIKPCETLFISHIPAKSCTIPDIFNHFRKYGHIMSIYAFGNQASITFSTKEEAITAFKSPEAFANNRFVKYFYHGKPDKAYDRLSLIADTDYVQSVLQEVRANIAQKERDYINLQSKLKSLSHHSNDSNSQNSNEDANLDNGVKDLLNFKEQIQQSLIDLRKEEKTADPKRKLEIAEKIKKNQDVLDDIESTLKKV